ncbi:MAG: alpha/beta hydrolase [Chlamydiota bacterium]|nr:alpha/beta hydrolase [Chlamydiota bacterium]
MKIIIVIAMVLMLVNVFKDFEKNQIYFPTKDLESTPAEIGLTYEDVELNAADDVRLHGWFVPRQNARYVILIFHGNAGNISHRIPDLKRFYEFGWNVFIIDYRGYGKSEGSPSEEGTYTDAESAWRYLREVKDFQGKDIVIFGRSLGAAVAIDLCTHHQPLALITESTFTSVLDMARKIYPMLPVHLFLTIKYDSLSKIKNVQIPKLFLHSPDDEIIPFQHGQDLFDAAPMPKELFVMQGLHNNGFLITEGYAQTIKSFLDRVGSEQTD